MFSSLRMFKPPEFPVLSLGVQAGLGEELAPEHSQFSLLVRHSLNRFFNNDLISAEGDAKARLLQLMHAVALPGLVVALFLFPLYHRPLPRAFWAQVSDHYFYVVYSFVALGVLSLFAWDLHFPDALDIHVLTPLPVRHFFHARVLAASLFLGLFVVGINALGGLFYPLLTEQPGVMHHAIAHMLAVVASGAFAALFFLALQSVLMSVLGDRVFRILAPFLQAIFTTVLLTTLLLFPASAQFLELLLENPAGRYFPPFWFLGAYEVLLVGPFARSVFHVLARTGILALLVVAMLVVLTYPLAYRRRMRYLVEGSGSVAAAGFKPVTFLLHRTFLRNRVQRGIYHFISYSLLRTQRYRVYLAMYSGLGLSFLITCTLLLNVRHGHLGVVLSRDGARAALPIVAFWVIAGLRTAFFSPTDRRGNWVFRVILGRPGPVTLRTAWLWIFPCALVFTATAAFAFSRVNLLLELLVAFALCVVLTDALLVNVTTLPFTGEARASTSNLAWILLAYFGLFPPLVILVVDLEPWLAAAWWHGIVAAGVVAAVHVFLRNLKTEQAEYNANLIDIDGEEEEFPQRLGLRY